MAGALTGIGTAIVETRKAAVNASLDDHFGDIALSMDQIQRAADNIIGSKKMENIEKLMSSIKISEGFEREMKKAVESIEKIEWKVSAGLKLDDDDMKKLEKSTQDYIQAAQDQIDQQGYTVNVAAKVLFGNSDKGKELIEEDNSIFAALEMEAQGLAARINSTLEEAMEKGLTPDLKKALDGYLEEMGELTRTMADAETEASWDVLAADFSGKDLDADTYQKMQDAVNKNIETVEKTEKEARDTLINNARKKFAAGYISEEERQTQVDDANKQYEENIKKAKAKGVEFQYNTLMDAYGEKIATGNYEDGDKSAIQKIIDPMMETAKTTDQDIYNKLLDISIAATPGMQNPILSSIDGFFANMQGKTSLYDTANKGAQEVAGVYVNEKSAKEYNTFLAGLSSEAKTFFKNVDFVNPLAQSAKQDGEKAGKEFEQNFRNTVKEGLNSGVTANMPLAINPSVPGISVTNKGKKQSKSTSPIIFPPIRGNAEGIISTKAHIAAVSEGNKTEAIIPIDGSARSRRLYEATGKLMGYNKNSGQSVTFAPTINITLTGKASAEDKNEIRNLVQKELEKQYKKMVRDSKRFDMRQ